MGQTLPKNRFRFWNSEKKCWNKNQHSRDTMCVNLQAKRTRLTFSAQICPKMDFGLDFQKTNVGTRTSILEIPFKNLSLDLESAPPIRRVCQFSVKMDDLKFFSLNLGKLPNYKWYFGSKRWGYCRELVEDWNEPGGGGWS